tara:strand:- start:21 stop:293 length:273 start_codon:yes stop_codon:yes gene_type:complete
MDNDDEEFKEQDDKLKRKVASILQEAAGVDPAFCLHMRFMGENYFNNMETEEVMETIERNLSHQVIALTEGIFERYQEYQDQYVNDEIRS